MLRVPSENLFVRVDKCILEYQNSNRLVPLFGVFDLYVYGCVLKLITLLSCHPRVTVT